MNKFVAIDPLKFQKAYWPHINLYDKQRELLYSSVTNKETYAPAGTELGKDFTAALIVLYHFIAFPETRIITTSVADEHLDVMWGEINRFIDTSVVPLDSKNGGPLVIKYHEIQKIVGGKVCKISYLKGMVAKKGEKMAGHHARHTLLVADECSGIDDDIYAKCSTWADHMVFLGNPYDCDNFFKRAVEHHDEHGDEVLEIPGRTTDPNVFLRKTIRMRAEDSPNVKYSLERVRAGLDPGEEIVPGVLSYDNYVLRRRDWDEIKQCVCMDARFYKGSNNLLYPPDWLNQCEKFHAELERDNVFRKATALGIDPAEGNAETCGILTDEYGIIPGGVRICQTGGQGVNATNSIVAWVIGMIEECDLECENVLLDAGGGGRQIADILRGKGYPVRTVGFGEKVTPDEDLPYRKRSRSRWLRMKEKERKYVCKNKRAEMYFALRDKTDPRGDGPYAIPPEEVELRRQLALMPLMQDGEGRYFLPPKYKRNPKSKEKTLTQIIGRSPDRADALVLSIEAGKKKPELWVGAV